MSQKSANALQVPKPSRAAGLITVQLGPELKTQWLQLCQSRNLVPGKAFRSLVDKALTDDSDLSAASARPTKLRITLTKEPDRGPKIGREIQFTPSENEAIEAAATAQRFGFQDWVVAAVRAALVKAPSFGQAELETLTRSNALLGQAVVELGQWRRSQNGSRSNEVMNGEEPAEGDEFSPMDDVALRLHALEATLKTHVETVSASMAQGARRWQLKH